MLRNPTSMKHAVSRIISAMAILLAPLPAAGDKPVRVLVWNSGKGRMFYFRPCHETYPVFRQKENLPLLENAVRWLRPSNR